MKSPEPERVRRHTSARSNQRIDATIAKTIQNYAGRTEGAIAARLDQLDREWDIERVLQANAATVAMIGAGLGSIHRRWLLLTSGVLSFLMVHAVQGWCPPLPLFRWMGVRTRGEIEKEKFALRFLRGDFDHLRTPGRQVSVPRLLRALQG
jgi:hypothetical protein